MPIEFSSAYVIPMNLDSFVGVSAKYYFYIKIPFYHINLLLIYIYIMLLLYCVLMLWLYFIKTFKTKNKKILFITVAQDIIFDLQYTSTNARSKW